MVHSRFQLGRRHDQRNTFGKSVLTRKLGWTQLTLSTTFHHALFLVPGEGEANVILASPTQYKEMHMKTLICGTSVSVVMVIVRKNIPPRRCLPLET